MIAGISGTVARLGVSSVYIDTGGLEYEVFVPLNVFDELSRTSGGERVRLYIYHHFMQDEQRLFGFREPGQRDLFIAVKNLKGLGTSLALSLLSHLNGKTLLELCERKDVKALTKLPRVGKATAETIIFEVNRKRDKWEQIVGVGEDGVPGEDVRGSEEELAYQALIQLGYKEKEAKEALLKHTSEKDGGGLSASELIREALRLL